MKFATNENCRDVFGDDLHKAIAAVLDHKATPERIKLPLAMWARTTDEKARVLRVHLDYAVFWLSVMIDRADLSSDPQLQSDLSRAMDIFGEVMGERPLTTRHMYSLLPEANA